MTQPVAEDELLARLAELTREHGRFPSTAQLRFAHAKMPEFPGEKTFRNRFGGHGQVLDRLRSWIDGKQDLVPVAGDGQRLEGICTAAGVQLSALDVQVITTPPLRLDLEADRASLDETVAKLEPCLLVLDPFVRLHRIDENASGEEVPLLAYLRELQRRHGVAVALVHHARKGGGRARAGQALRGSSEFHAWGDSNLYLRRHGDDLTLAVEHRAAASVPSVPLVLAKRGDALALEVLDRAPAAEPAPTSVGERITRALAAADGPLPLAELRTACRVRNATLRERLAALTAAGKLVRAADGYRLAAG
jgi:hypothetical protein